MIAFDEINFQKKAWKINVSKNQNYVFDEIKLERIRAVHKT